jgi:hypothetical protein
MCSKMHGTDYLHELAHWVEQQRTDFVLFVNSGKSCPLLQERFDLLTGEGFTFAARSDVAWEPDYRKIQGCVKAHGHCLAFAVSERSLTRICWPTIASVGKSSRWQTQAR